MGVDGRLPGALCRLRHPGQRYCHFVSPPERLSVGIDLVGVGFRYPGTEPDVLTDVDLRFRAGSVVALVGENGAGETTLVKLLSRCYEPSEGRILVDGVDLAGLDVAGWRRRVSAGFQDFARFQFVLREAVGIGELDRIDDIAAVELALARSQASGLGASLPDGLETQLGKLSEGGAVRRSVAEGGHRPSLDRTGGEDHEGERGISGVEPIGPPHQQADFGV